MKRRPSSSRREINQSSSLVECCCCDGGIHWGDQSSSAHTLPRSLNCLLCSTVLWACEHHHHHGQLIISCPCFPLLSMLWSKIRGRSRWQENWWQQITSGGSGHSCRHLPAHSAAAVHSLWPLFTLFSPVLTPPMLMMVVLFRFALSGRRPLSAFSPVLYCWLALFIFRTFSSSVCLSGLLWSEEMTAVLFLLSLEWIFSCSALTHFTFFKQPRCLLLLFEWRRLQSSLVLTIVARS